MSSGRGRGRLPQHHIAADGTQIKGLARRPSDGRWRVIGTNVTFTEPDEKRAIAKFYELTDGPNVSDLIEKVEELSRVDGPRGQLWESIAATFRTSPPDPTPEIKKLITDAAQLHKSIEGRSIYFKDAKEMWQYFASEVRERPRYVAEQTGIEQLGYYRQLRPPKPLPTFAELEQVFRDHFKKSGENRRKVLAAWEDFKQTSGAKSIEEITPELVVKYRDQVYARGGTGKSQVNIFSRVRRLLSFAKSRAVAVKEISEALQNLSLLVPSDTTISLDPKPIEVEDWRKLYDAAKCEDRAMVLLMLNAAMYCTEVVRLKWSDIRADGTLITHRAKEGKCARVAVLWAETLEALDKLPRKGDHLFYAWNGKPLGVKGAELRFRKLRIAAEIPHVTSSMLRDGAATAAASANVNQQLISLLMGHRTGIADHYVKRNGKMVKPATDAIHALYISRPHFIARARHGKVRTRDR